MSHATVVSALPESVAETVVTVGTFDGVHRGHVDVLERLAERGRSTGRASVLVTFPAHPLELLKPELAPLLLTSLDEKLVCAAATGIDYVAVLPFTRALADHSASQFVDLVLRRRFRMADLLIGYDHGFGRGRAGDVETVRALGVERGFDVEVVVPVYTPDGIPVSSTRIRTLIQSGELDGARLGLGRTYTVTGTVAAGEARGRGLGYPTINVVPDNPRKLLPPDGVYAVVVEGRKGRFMGMLNLGGRPTFGDERRSIEAHLFDASGDFYGDVVQVGFVARLRDTRRFENVEALMAQLRADDQAARRALTNLAS